MSALRPVRPATANRPAFAMPPSAELADALAFLVAGGRRNRPAFAMPGRLLTAPGPMPIEWLVPRFVQPSPRISAPPPAAAVLETTEAPLAPVTAPRRPRVLLGGV
jgi:hypothetical protein